MAKNIEADRRRLGDIKLKPAQVRTPAAAPQALVERRNGALRAALVRRVRDEFEEMPGLSLTLVQASKLFGLQLETCARILSELRDEGVVHVKSDGQFALRTEAA